MPASDIGRGPDRARHKWKRPGHRWGSARPIQSPAGDHASKASHRSILLPHTVLRGQPAKPVPGAKLGNARLGAGSLKAGPSLQASATCPEVHTPALAPATATGARNPRTVVPARAGNLGASARQ